MNDYAQTEQLRGIVGTVLPPGQRDDFVEYARLDAFRGEDGQLDTEKVMGHLTAIYAATQPQQPRQWGQYSGGQPGEKPGAAARSALQKRHGVRDTTDQPAAGARITPGANGRAALQRRHGKRNR